MFFFFQDSTKSPQQSFPFLKAFLPDPCLFFFFKKELLPSRDLHSCFPQPLLTAADLITPTDPTLKGQTDSITPLCFQKNGWEDTDQKGNTHPLSLPLSVSLSLSPHLSLYRLLIGIHLTKEGKWQPTPVFLPGESPGQGSLVGCCLWGRRVGHDWSDLAAVAAAATIRLVGWQQNPKKQNKPPKEVVD